MASISTLVLFHIHMQNTAYLKNKQVQNFLLSWHHCRNLLRCLMDIITENHAATSQVGLLEHNCLRQQLQSSQTFQESQT